MRAVEVCGYPSLEGLCGRPRDWHGHNNPAHFGIRTERYKLIFFYGCTPSGGEKTPVAWELYDLQNDPSEMQNQYANPEYAKVVADLKRRLWETRAALNETDRNYPQVQAIIDAHTGTPR